MTDRNKTDDAELDLLIHDSLTRSPSDTIVKNVMPWKKSMQMVLWSMALMITVKIPNAEYITLFISFLRTVLAFSGLRVLRKENKFFKTCYIISIVDLVVFFLSSVAGSTIYGSLARNDIATYLSYIFNPLIMYLYIICLWTGVARVRAKAKLTTSKKSMAAMLVCYSVFVVFIWLRASISVFAFIPPAASFYLLIRSLHKLSRELTAVGYSVTPAPIKIPDFAVVAVISGLLLVCMSCGYIFGNSYKTDWQPQSVTQNAEVEEVKAHLTELGFPEGILDDITDEDILACKSATRVEVDENDEPFNNGRKVVEKHQNSTQYKTVYDKYELHLIGVGVQLSDENKWKIFHHFTVTDDTKFYGTETLMLVPDYERAIKLWEKSSEVTGQILYDENGKSYVSPYYFLGKKTLTQSSTLWGNNTYTHTFAEFSMPNKVSNRRGYITYTTQTANKYCRFSSELYYTHQKSWLQYPALTAAENPRAGGLNSDGVFLRCQGYLQFDTKPPAQQNQLTE